MTSTVIQTRIDADVKNSAESILKALGLGLNDGIRLFLNQVRIDRAIPFKPALSEELNEDTLEAIRRVEAGIGLRKVSSFNEFLREMEA